MKQLVVAEPAACDLEEIVDFIALDNPVAAEKVYWGILSAAEKLPEFQPWAALDAILKRENLVSQICRT